MNQETEYVIELEEKFGFSTLMDLPAFVAATKEKWFNQTLCHVNDSVIRLGILEGEFHWHKHDEEDEFFLVLEGKLLIDLEADDNTIELGPHQGYAVPKGVVHRTRASQKAVVLMVEQDSVVPTGD
ncbi:MAG: cupin domain-containing protein [Chloroflexi bacterium]|nr:cupin domain-containing protein [Chloroflexota bacterium]